MERCLLDYSSVTKKKWFPYVCGMILFACIIARFFTGPVSNFGGNVCSVMSADHWNFAKDMLHGKVMYVDLIDHKGLYLYVPYMILYLVSGGWFEAVQIGETIAYVATLLAFYKMSCLLLEEDTAENKVLSLFATTLFSIVFLLVSRKTCLLNTEGYATIAMLLFYGYISKKKKASPTLFFVIGLVLGCLFNMKLTIIAPFFPLFLFVCMLHLKNNGTKMELIKSIPFGILGFFVVNIPFVAYLVITNSFQDMMRVFGMSFFIASSLRYDIVFASIVSIVFSIVCYLKEKEYLLRFFLLLSIVGMELIFGKDNSYYFVFYVAVLFTSLFWKKKVNVAFAIAFIPIFLYFGIRFTNPWLEKYPTRKIAEELSITNDNILYISEDYGYGVYSQEPYRIPCQWVPDTLLYSKEFKNSYFEYVELLIANKEFKYISALPYEAINIYKEAYPDCDYSGLNFYTRTNMELYDIIVPILEKNYTPSKKYPSIYIANE